MHFLAIVKYIHNLSADIGDVHDFAAIVGDDTSVTAGD